MVTELRWLDLDPATHAFEPRAAEARVRALVAGAVRNEYGRDQCAAAIHDAIVETHGTWAAGWRWSPNEPGGGGPSHGWCCARDSVLRAEDPGPHTTVERALGAVASWRQFLEELSARFAALRAEQATVEQAAAQLLPYVLERTGAEDAWYATFAAVVGWFGEPLVGDVETMREEVHALVSGRFSSWMTPTDEAASRTCRELDELVARTPARDALAAWLDVRESAFGDVALEPAHDAVTDDGHQRFIATHDRARDPVRAERMTAALEMCRASARSGMALSLGQLAEWQALVLGESRPVELRTGDAFAKRGRERYPLVPELRELAERLLADASDAAAPPAVRAARAYLDVCFLHPFPDGNARAARLALDHVLTGAGLALRAAAPVFVLSRSASDARGAASFAGVIDRLTGPSDGARSTPR